MTTRGAVGAAQTTPRPGDINANTEEHIRLARLAAEQSVELLLFPELSLTGYELGSASELAFTREDSRLEPLRLVATELQMTLVVGAPVRLDERLHIAALILFPDGKSDLYTKQRLGAFPPAVGVNGIVPPPEASIFEAGDRNPLLETKSGTAAIAICADVGRPTHAQAAAERGASIYLASSFIVPADFEGEAAKLRGSAARLGMVVVFANYGGVSGQLLPAGRSSVWSSSGELLARLERSGSGVAFALPAEGDWQGGTVVLTKG